MQPIPFVKLHGLGNDYVYVDEREITKDQCELLDELGAAHWSQRLADRHRGIGGDGLIVLRRDAEAACRMEMYNADGSRAEMCGNGIRCVAALAWARGYADRPEFWVDSDDGPKLVRIAGDEAVPCAIDPTAGLDAIAMIAVDMGVPVFEAERERVDIGGRTFEGTVLSLGNPHFVVPLEAPPRDYAVEEYGPRLERHPRFPNRANIEFVYVADRGRIDFRVWERGSGETQACGTGATAAAAALHRLGLIDDRATVRLLGGSLEIELARDGHAWMTGPAEQSFRGTFSATLVSG